MIARPQDGIKNLIRQMVQAVVLSPEQVQVQESLEDDATVYVVFVAPGDIGYAIGKEGRVASAIRTVVKEAAKRNGIKVYLDVKGYAPGANGADPQLGASHAQAQR